MNSQLFWYKLIFLAELILVTGLFVFRFKRRNYFILRLIISFAACFAIAFFYPILFYNAWYTSIMFIIIFITVLFAIKFCFKEPWINVLFCGIVAYTVRHFSFLTYNFIVTAFGLVQVGAMGAYLNIPLENYNAWTIFTYFVTYYIIYWVAFMFFVRQIKRNKDLSIKNYALLTLSLVIILVDVVFNAIIVYYSAEHFDLTYIVINYLYGMISCGLVIFIQFTLLGKKQLREDLNTAQTLRAQEHKQYLMSKDNIELINIKCHDLKHQISGLRGRINEEELNEMEKAVLIYDLYVKTGNEVLDVLLTEKSLFCEKNDIQISCVADITNLDFIAISDLYSLFGNAIDNAIEAVLKLSDKSKRIITLNIKTTHKLLSLHIDNFYSGKVKFIDGLPQTTKADNKYHGFGMKSIKLIVDKYDGNVIARVDEDLFKLDILLPITEKSNTE